MKSNSLFQTVKVLNDMLFVHNCIPLDRFFISIVLHPNDDESIVRSMSVALSNSFPAIRVSSARSSDPQAHELLAAYHAVL